MLLSCKGVTATDRPHEKYNNCEKVSADSIIVDRRAEIMAASRAPQVLFPSMKVKDAPPPTCSRVHCAHFFSTLQ